MRNLKSVKLTFLTIFIVLVHFACNSQKQSETIENTGQEKAVSNEISERSAKISSGAEIYKTNCAKCHGESGEGTDKGISFLKGHALRHSEEDFIKQVTNGEGDEMPAFKDKLTEEQIKTVVKYVRAEIQKNADKNASENHQH